MCVDVDVDRANCGACGNACGDGEVCAAGSCELSCTAETTECSGACRDLDTDRAHCGACGNACGDGQECLAGACAATCGAPLTSCADDSGGYCADTTGDADNCGACGATCADGEACIDSACLTQCPVGTLVCDSVDGVLCVDDPSTDRDNCGGCGVTCDSDEDCVGGACQACEPSVVRIPGDEAPTPPTDMRVSCFSGPTPVTLADCPVVACGALATWAFSYNDNRNAFGVVTYDPSGGLVRQSEQPGGRYVWDATLDTAAETATFVGQSNGSATIPWSLVRLP